MAANINILYDDDSDSEDDAFAVPQAILVRTEDGGGPARQYIQVFPFFVPAKRIPDFIYSFQIYLFYNLAAYIDIKPHLSHDDRR